MRQDGIQTASYDSIRESNGAAQKRCGRGSTEPLNYAKLPRSSEPRKFAPAVALGYESS